MTESSEGGDQFAGRRAIVTGASRGIGRAVAERLAGRGATVHLVARSEETRQVATRILAFGGHAVVHIGSVAEEAFCAEVVGVTEQHGGCDIVVNAAAILGATGPFEGLSMAAFGDVISTNLLGTAYLMRHALPGMESRGFGRIINFAGGGAAYAYPNFAPYAASKAALVRLTETVAEELRSGDVTTNIIAPGAVATDMLAAVRRAGGEVRTVTDVEEALDLVTFLASPFASHINGRFIHVRDDYRDRRLFESSEMLKLRRTERR